MGGIYSSSYHSLLGILLASCMVVGGFLSFTYISLKLFEKVRINFYRFCLFGGCFFTQTLRVFEVEYLTFMTTPEHPAGVFRDIPRVTSKCFLELQEMNKFEAAENVLHYKSYNFLLFQQSWMEASRNTYSNGAL